MKFLRTLLLVIISGAIASVSQADPIVLRVGHFPNVTHAQGVIATRCRERGRDGSKNGWGRT